MKYCDGFYDDLLKKIMEKREADKTSINLKYK